MRDLPTVAFYRVEVTEFLGIDEGLKAYTFFIFPPSLESIISMFKNFKARYELSDPELIELKVDPETGKVHVPEEKNMYMFVK